MITQLSEEATSLGHRGRIGVVKAPTVLITMNIYGAVPTSEEELAFLVSHICQGFQQQDVLDKFNEKFSKDLKTAKFESLLVKINDESKRALLVAAQKYDWFNPELPQYYDFSLPCIVQLSTISWPMEHRAFALHFRARGLTPRRILEDLNDRYRPERTIGALNHELTYLQNNTGLMEQLQEQFPKFVWWEPEPPKGGKEWNAMNRRTRIVEATERKKAHMENFGVFGRRATAAAAGRGDIFRVEDQEKVKLSSSPPLRNASTIPSSSSSFFNPETSKQAFRTSPPPSFFSFSPSPAGAPTASSAASASSPFGFPTRPGAYSDDGRHEDLSNEEEEDSFAQPFHSPDADSSSFPTLNPTRRRLPGAQLSYGPILPSSSTLSSPTGAEIPGANPTTSSPTYLSAPLNAPSNLAHGPFQSSFAREGRFMGAFDISEPYDYYNPGRSSSGFSNDDPRPSPSAPHFHRLPMAFRTPYSPGAPPPSFATIRPTQSYLRNTPQDPKGSSSSPGLSPSRSTSSSSKHPKQEPAT